ncbi:FMN-dependent NADH-azoreductase [Inquilinus sp.]|jgi:FMN-dependent NADH-azoreductase|uniref:FMN-dependent NADH-azoreductase n=1 Tax=Inquilinus sp. TaxID=1932117 RepID=UPI003782F773
MTTILHIDSSARLGRSHTRRLSARFIEAWRARRPQDMVIRRDVGLEPPPPVTEAWIAAAFTKPERRTPEMRAALAVSDALVDELERADLIVAGVPMYNFGLPAQMKAWVDNIVRVGRTFGFDRSRPGEPYWPMLSGKRLVTLGARGDWGYQPGERLAGLNHVEPHLQTVFRYLGIPDAVSIAAEYDEFADERIQQSLQAAEAEIDRLVARMTAEAQAAA